MKEIPEILKPYEDFFRSTEKPSIEISFKRGHTLPWESKCGGCPYLESEDDYPRNQNGEPMIFLAQLNFDEMPHLENFPEHGLLQFYICHGDKSWSSWLSVGRVIYIPEYKKNASGLLSVNPFEESYLEEAPFEAEGKMIFQLSTRFISSDCPEFIDKFEDIFSTEEYGKANDLCYAAGSRVGGYPLFVQGYPPERYGEDECDTLLLQLDCDDECGIMFGDSGCCYFLISKEDLKNKNFDRVEYGWQCC